MPKRIIYTRHPECLHNVNHVQALQSGIENRKSPLTIVGELQRDITADYLRREFSSIDSAICSTYTRTHAIPVAAGFESILSENSLLDERSMGVWHTHLPADVLKMHPGEDERLKAVGYYAYEAPLGESCVGVERRLSEFVSSGVLDAAGDTVYISGHGISGLCLRRVLTGGSLEDWHSWSRLKNASVTVYEQNEGGYVCTSYNVVPWEGLIDPSLLTRKSTEA